jgi:hypothetical protein
MKNKLIEMRIDFLKKMDDYIFDMKNDNLWDDWNDGITEILLENPFKIIAENDNYWKETCKLFGELVKERED